MEKKEITDIIKQSFGDDVIIHGDLIFSRVGTRVSDIETEERAKVHCQDLMSDLSLRMATIKANYARTYTPERGAALYGVAPPLPPKITLLGSVRSFFAKVFGR